MSQFYTILQFPLVTFFSFCFKLWWWWRRRNFATKKKKQFFLMILRCVLYTRGIPGGFSNLFGDGFNGGNLPIRLPSLNENGGGGLFDVVCWWNPNVVIYSLQTSAWWRCSLVVSAPTGDSVTVNGDSLFGWSNGNGTIFLLNDNTDGDLPSGWRAWPSELTRFCDWLPPLFFLQLFGNRFFFINIKITMTTAAIRANIAKTINKIAHQGNSSGKIIF